MKFMKLGSKPDAFQAEGSCVRYVSSELATDVIVNVGSVKFHLHKFPLLSKSNKLQKLVSEANEESPDGIQLVDFPGGPRAFEICAKFCYGVTVTLNPYNVVAVRCAAEYLEMTEDIDKGNLILKIEVFLNSSLLHNWKDSIIVLQTTMSLLPWSENLKIVGRCIDSISSKTSVDPSVITWSYTYNRKLATSDQILRSGLKLAEKMESVPRDWWVEDICELDIDLYKRVMLAIKSKGRMDGGVIGEALKTYAMRWLPDSVDALLSEVHIHRNKSLVETIICLLPSDKAGISCACSFLLKLLKVAILIEADDSSREELIKSISLKLDEASVNDLLIPARPPQTTVYDIELVQRLVAVFVANEMSKKDLKIIEKNGKNDSDFVLGHGSWLKVGKIIDGYLSAVACDRNLPVSSFIKLSQSIPEMARPIHDGLYGAIDIFLKEHSALTKSERKNLCGLMDVKKLTTDASMHAAQNEQLPLRVVVQVLFFEQARAAAFNNGHDAMDPPRKTEENWGKTVPENRKSLRKQMDEMKIKEEDSLKNGKLAKRGSKNRGSGPQLLPSRSRRIFDKLWIVGKGLASGENKSSETSASSQSPTSMIRGETKSSGSSSRHRRHSIS
ncbi:Phototropic-responsive NPH3 family protein [Perilla frutescens var. hirtella]|nr:Phototropic-responsive NPH3 family protein [Perilla frutescens var. frutescens]KAH6783680.1 Phototropic-responsive NPH3 family protein [Perilla frutescens var. hirtella]